MLKIRLKLFNCIGSKILLSCLYLIFKIFINNDCSSNINNDKNSKHINKFIVVVLGGIKTQNCTLF